VPLDLDLGRLDLVYISFDEPRAERTFAEIEAIRPEALRIHGVRGFNAAHRAAAEAARTDWFITVDGDNVALDAALLASRLELPAVDEPCIVSFHARNRLNGNVYGNGGVKLWLRELALGMRTHEEAADRLAGTEFCWALPWYKLPMVASEILVTETPFQAFRAGFREGVKLATPGGVSAREALPSLPLDQAFRRHVWSGNRDRLAIWCAVGADVPNGLVAIYGARLALAMLHLDDWEARQINDFDWFRGFWFDVVYDRLGLGLDQGRWLRHEIEREGRRIEATLGLDLALFDEQGSRFFKTARPAVETAEGFIDRPPASAPAGPSRRVAA
jgi:hypothetical protein